MAADTFVESYMSISVDISEWGHPHAPSRAVVTEASKRSALQCRPPMYSLISWLRNFVRQRSAS